MQIICSTLPDLIISDCLLYVETVIDLLVWMKLKKIDIPVIAVSAAEDETLSVAVVKNGANCFYDKLDLPFSKYMRCWKNTKVRGDLLVEECMKEKILIADDDIELVKMLRTFLNSETIR